MGNDVVGPGMIFVEASLQEFTAANFGAVEMLSWQADVLLSRGESESRRRCFWQAAMTEPVETPRIGVDATSPGKTGGCFWVPPTSDNVRYVRLI